MLFAAAGGEPEAVLERSDNDGIGDVVWAQENFCCVIEPGAGTALGNPA